MTAPLTTPMTDPATATAPVCDPDTRVTRSLLGYGVIAGPFYVAVSLAQALTRTGFDPTRHEWSLLANGGLGWIQITNLILSGLMTIAFAVGVGRATGSRWARRLLAGYGLSLVGAGVFRADPALGFPPGTPADAHEVSWPGLLHVACGGIGFICLAAACLVLGRRYARGGRPGRAAYARVTGVLFLVGFAGVASGTRSVWTVLGFTAAVVFTWAWMSLTAVDLYRRPASA